MPDDLLYRDEVRIIGACMAVHKDKGNGFVEPVYQDALEIELELFGIPFDAQRNYQIHYRERPLKHSYTPDLLCFDKIIVELKAAKALTDEHRAQLMNYLKVTGLPLGLLVNFGSYPRLEWERIILSHS
ncbi:MAG: GxxExxY protein [bacterium]|nr:GxxExxY protein [bacterium]MDI1334687.1 GxxExxY protein [Lacunisphaera sp.]